jgi:membrane-associated phospholipid phosphatase
METVADFLLSTPCFARFLDAPRLRIFGRGRGPWSHGAARLRIHDAVLSCPGHNGRLFAEPYSQGIRAHRGDLDNDMNLFSTGTWIALTNLGAAFAILPMVPAIGLGLWQESRYKVAVAWSTALFAGILIVLISKFAFIGWGLGVASLDFTGVSGHTMLAAAILPVVFTWLPLPRPLSILATLLGVALAVLIGWSRVVLGAHSWSEVAAGWCLGAMVSATALFVLCRTKADQPALPVMQGLIVVILMLIFALSQTAAVKLPTHSMEVRLALALSGHERPFRRGDLYRPAAIEARLKKQEAARDK